MAIAPYNCNARIVFPVTVRSVTHDIHVACNSNDDIGTGPTATLFGASGASVSQDLQLAADLFWAYIRPFYEASAGVGVVRLEKKLTTGWAIIGSVLASTPAGSGGAVNPCSVCTISMKASDNTYVKLRLPETNLVVPQKGAVGAGTVSGIDTLVAAITQDPVSTDISAWFTSRSGNRVISSTYFFTTYSRQLRKKRGLL